MAKYETIKSEYMDYGQNRFIEISKKRILPEGATFMNLSKGYYTPEGERKYQGGLGFPDDESLIDKIIRGFRCLNNAEQ